MSLQNLFVAKLPRNLTDNDLHQIFAVYGPTSAKIMLDAATGRSKGFGFVLFDSVEKGEKAYKALNRKSTRACGHNFTLAIYPSNHDGKIATEASNSLYIRNIPVSVPKEKVESFLKTFGNLVYCAMREDHYGSPVWVVYAEYERMEEAKNALAKLHGNSTFFHGSAPILAKFEDTDDAKRERRKRREGTGNAHSVPSSGCVFPPPRPHIESSSHPDNTVNPSSSSAGGSSPAGAANKAGVLPAGMATSSSIGATVSLVDSLDFANTAPTPTSHRNNFLFAKHPPQPPQLDAMRGYYSSHSSGISELPAAFPLHAQFATGTATSHFASTNFGNGAVHHAPYANMNSSPSAPRNAFATAMLPSPPSQAYSLPVNPQLLQPTPGYCYSIAGTGRQIFIPSSTLSPSPDLAHAASASGAAHFQRGSGATAALGSGLGFSTGSALVPGPPGLMGAALQSAPPFLTTGSPMQGSYSGSGNVGATGSNVFPLLSPQASSPAVLVDGGHQFVLSGDAVNLEHKGISSNGAGSPLGHGASFPGNAVGERSSLFPSSGHLSSTSQHPDPSPIPFLGGPPNMLVSNTRSEKISNAITGASSLSGHLSPTQGTQQQTVSSTGVGDIGAISASQTASASGSGSGNTFLFLRGATAFDA